MPHIITVTRQFGSLGRQIARKMAEELYMKYYDRDIIDITARNMGMNVNDLMDWEGKKLSVYDKMLHPLGIGNAAAQERVYKIEKSVILELATNQDCIFVGRCVDYLLKDVEDCLSIYIYAPVEYRIKNSVETLGLSKKEAVKYVKGVDKARMEFYRHNAGADYDSMSYRDILIDSSCLGQEETARFLCNMAKIKFGL